NGGAAIEVGRQIIRLHRGRLLRVSRLDLDRPATLRPQLADRHREAREVVGLRTGEIGGERSEVKLYVGRFRLRQDAREERPLVDADRERSLLEQQPLQTDLHLAVQAVQIVVGGDRIGAFVHEPKLQVVLQVRADTREVDGYRNPALREQRGRTDARELQQLRRLQRSGAEEHLAPCRYLDRRAV